MHGAAWCVLSFCVCACGLFKRVCVFVHNCMVLYGMWFVRCCALFSAVVICLCGMCDLLCEVVCLLSNCVCVLCVIDCVMLSGACLFVFFFLNRCVGLGA